MKKLVLICILMVNLSSCKEKDEKQQLIFTTFGNVTRQGSSSFSILTDTKNTINFNQSTITNVMIGDRVLCIGEILSNVNNVYDAALHQYTKVKIMRPLYAKDFENPEEDIKVFGTDGITIDDITVTGNYFSVFKSTKTSEMTFVIMKEGEIDVDGRVIEITLCSKTVSEETPNIVSLDIEEYKGKSGIIKLSYINEKGIKIEKTETWSN